MTSKLQNAQAPFILRCSSNVAVIRTTRCFLLFKFQEGERDESKAFQCPKCIKGFNTKDQLRLHLLKHDVGSKPTDAFVCIECPLIHKIFKTQEELDDHKALVHGEEGVPKDCPHCGKSIE